MKILICHRDSGSQKLVARLASALPEFELLESLPDAPITQLDGISALIAVGKVDRSAMERGRFGFIQTIGTGYEHVDLAAATELGILVANMPASQTGNAESVAEHAILLMLALSRQLTRAQQNFRERRWAQPLGHALLGKTALLIGLGDVGQALATRLLAFGMNVIATRQDAAKPGPARVQILPAHALPDALPQADYLILCARPNAQNHNLIDAQTLQHTKRGAILINIARAELLDHDALYHALLSGHLRGACLDVFPDEPADPTHPLYSLENVIATPHIAGVTDVNMARTLQLTAENLRRFARSERPHFLLNSPLKPRGIPTVLSVDPLNC
jgi:phosphoglycerate dehydrogenase-like enzyme